MADPSAASPCGFCTAATCPSSASRPPSRDRLTAPPCPGLMARSTLASPQLGVDVIIGDRPACECIPSVQDQRGPPATEHPYGPEIAGARDGPDHDQERVDHDIGDDVRGEAPSGIESLAGGLALRRSAGRFRLHVGAVFCVECCHAPPPMSRPTRAPDPAEGDQERMEISTCTVSQTQACRKESKVPLSTGHNDVSAASEQRGARNQSP